MSNVEPVFLNQFLIPLINNILCMTHLVPCVSSPSKCSSCSELHLSESRWTAYERSSRHTAWHCSCDTAPWHPCSTALPAWHKKRPEPGGEYLVFKLSTLSVSFVQRLLFCSDEGRHLRKASDKLLDNVFVLQTKSLVRVQQQELFCWCINNKRELGSQQNRHKHAVFST